MDDKELFEYLLYSDMEDMPDTFLSELWEQKGVEAVSAVLDIPVHMEIEEYEMDISLRAVDTDIFPLKIDRCLTELEAGSKILFILHPRPWRALRIRISTKSQKGKRGSYKTKSGNDSRNLSGTRRSAGAGNSRR